MIPKIIHQVWAGHDPIPYRYRAHIESWQKHHPDWEYRLWTPTEIEGLEMVNQELYDRAKIEAPNDWLRWRADIVRLEIAYQYGGIYADTDAECLKPLDPLLEKACWFAESPNAHGRVTQAVFGTEPGHPFFGLLLTNMVKSAAEYRGRRIVDSVGPGYVQRMRETTGADVEMLPWYWFAGRSIKGARKDQRPNLSEAYCWHKYDNLGNKNLPETKKVIRRFQWVADRLNGSGIQWFITYGLMLGHIREGRILPWDGDIDIGIWPEDMATAVSLFPEAQVNRQLERQFKGLIGGVRLDIHSYYRNGDTLSNYLGTKGKIRYDQPAHLFDNAQPSIFYLRDVLIPSPPEEYLEVRYGPDWLTPQKVWKWNKDPSNMVYL